MGVEFSPPGAGGCHATQSRFVSQPPNPGMRRQPWLLQGSRHMTHLILKDRAPPIDPLLFRIETTPGGPNCFTAYVPGSVQAAIKVVMGGILGNGKSFFFFFFSLSLENLTVRMRMRGAGAGCLAAPPPPQTFLPLHLTSHSS